jgi:glutamate-ammonia-ligase adenylyltransferase
MAELGLAGASAGTFVGAIGYSDFLYRLCNRLGPEASAELLADAHLALSPERIRTFAAEASSLAVAGERGLAIIALREMADLAPTRASFLAASLLAETIIRRALAAESQTHSELTLFALGKLGGRELNFYSDLDLVFAASEAGCDREAERRVRLARRVLARLEDSWRVDLRLRPFGGAGPLAMGFPAMEAYFQNHGREWERYAWIKARPVAGDRRAGREFLARLHPFIYRRYLDYHAIEALRAMKRQIAAEAGASARDIKRGPGGIREIEFIVQAFQLVRGGREPALVGPRLRAALGAARRLKLLGERDARALCKAYGFLRRVENRLQMRNLSPEHRLPQDEALRADLATSLGYADWGAFAGELDAHRSVVRQIFDAIFGAPPTLSGRAPAARLWRRPDAERATALADELGFREPVTSAAMLATFKASRAPRMMSARARVALDRVAPDLIAAAADESDPDAALARLLELAAALVRRSAYLALIAERPAALERLAGLAGKSAWIARRLAASPVALDELLDPRLAAPAARGRLAQQFASALASADEPELASVRFREMVETERLKIAAGLADGSLSASAIERDLSLLGERAVRTALALAHARMCARHGALDCELLILGYGKLGSRELGFASDLDLVFLYETTARASAKGLAAEVWLARLAQRTISLLSSPTTRGGVYTVDTRLRPEGSAGLLISRFDAWRRYQHEQARVWEHQALLRARPVAGSARLARAFRVERAGVLAEVPAREALASEIVAMRARVADVGPRRSSRSAALLDGEFLATWWLLAAATVCPRALNRIGFGAQLEALADCGTARPARELAAALACLRAETNCTVLGLADRQSSCTKTAQWVSELWARESRPCVAPL